MAMRRDGRRGPAVGVGEIQWAWRAHFDSGRVSGLVGGLVVLVGFVCGWQEVVSLVWVLRAIVVGDVVGVAFGCSRMSWRTAFSGLCVFSRWWEGVK